MTKKDIASGLLNFSCLLVLSASGALKKERGPGIDVSITLFDRAVKKKGKRTFDCIKKPR